MEWIIEGVALIFIGSVNAIVTAIDPTSSISLVIYLCSAVVLIVLAFVSFLTGFKISFLPFKLCPVIFITAAVLIILGVLGDGPHCLDSLRVELSSVPAY